MLRRSKFVLILAAAAAMTGCGGASRATTGAGAAGNTSSGAGNALEQDALAKVNARTVQTAMETCYTDSQSYDNCDIATMLGNAAPALGSQPGQVEVQSRGQSYTVTSRSRSGEVFTIVVRNGAGQRTCSGSDPAGDCTGGTW